MSSETPQRWQREGRRPLLHTAIFDVHGTTFRHPVRDTTKEFVVIESNDWVVAVAVTPDDRIVLVRQYRFGSDTLSLELPGGIIDGDESPVAAAQRELAEETGFVGTSARVLGRAHPNPAIQSNLNHIVLIEGATRVRDLKWDEHEELEVLVWPVADALAAARDGRITHALMLNALFLFEPHWRRVGQ
jgi:8-oxo-dGTP pyrophosphatase MutT (NUDIX family)